MPWSPDSGLLNRVSLPFRPSHVLNSGCWSIRYFGMNQPMWPSTPSGPPWTTVPALSMYCLYWSTCCQSSSTASTLPSAMPWNTGISASFVISTLHPSLSSSTFFAMYVLAVEPAQACSLSTTAPQSLPPDALWLPPPESSSLLEPQAATNSASISAIATAHSVLWVFKLLLLLVELSVFLALHGQERSPARGSRSRPRRPRRTRSAGARARPCRRARRSPPVRR